MILYLRIARKALQDHIFSLERSLRKLEWGKAAENILDRSGFTVQPMTLEIHQLVPGSLGVVNLEDSSIYLHPHATIVTLGHEIRHVEQHTAPDYHKLLPQDLKQILVFDLLREADAFAHESIFYLQAIKAGIYDLEDETALAGAFKSGERDPVPGEEIEKILYQDYKRTPHGLLTEIEANSSAINDIMYAVFCAFLQSDIATKYQEKFLHNVKTNLA